MAKLFQQISKLFISSILFAIFVGCSPTSQPSYAKLGLVEVSGKITLDGEPLEGAAVYFHDRPNRRYSFGLTDANGRYKLMFDSRKSGVLPGSKEVEITTSKIPLELSAGSAGDEDGKPDMTERVPAKYNSESKLTFDVVKSVSNADFELNSR